MGKRLDQMTMQEKLAGLQAGAGMPSSPMTPTPGRFIDQRVTQEDSDRMKAAQQMLLQNSPTRDMAPPPTGQQLLQQDMDFNSAVDELGEGEEMTPEKAARFQRLFKK
jgi:hypothetical protein